MMSSQANALLPSGLRDVLPPAAAWEAAATERLMATFADNGYEQVSPPLVEFEDSLLSGVGAAMTRQTFRLMDPVSQRMMALRSDITPQMARIATTRLAGEPRPLRLSYAGTVLRVTAGQLRPERQFRQAGVELIGSEDAAADVEVVVLATEALARLGVEGLTVDLSLPTLVPAVCRAQRMQPELIARLGAALDRKDAALVASLADDSSRDLLVRLIAAGGPAERAIEILDELPLPEEAAAGFRRLADVVERLRTQAPDLTLTVDPVEHRGFEYHTGVSFTLFARGMRNELGRGGRYLVGRNGDVPDGEPATGVTLYMDVVHRALRQPPPRRRLYLPFGTPAAERRRMQAEGWVTVNGLSPAADESAEARRLRCEALLVKGDVITSAAPGSARDAEGE